MNPTTNGHAAAPAASNELTLVINWNPATDGVRATFPQVSLVILRGMLAGASRVLDEYQSKLQSDSRILVPDMQVTGKLTQ